MTEIRKVESIEFDGLSVEYDEDGKYVTVVIEEDMVGKAKFSIEFDTAVQFFLAVVAMLTE